MRNTRRLIGVLVGGAVLFTVNLGLSQDWPQWRGANRDGRASGFQAPQTWPQTLVEKWKVTVGSGDATPALAGGKLYVFTRQGDDEVIMCLNAKEGKELWQSKYSAQAVTGAASRHPGPRSSPTVADGKVVTLGATGVLSCLDAESGQLVWRSEELVGTVPQFFTAMSPIIEEGLCIAHLGGKEKGCIIAFDLASGDAKWKWTGEGPAYGSPVLMTVDGTRQLVTQTEKSILGLAVADGKMLWRIAAAAEGRFYNSATPIVEGQMVIYTGQGSGTKAVKIARQGEGFAVEPVWQNAEVGTGYNTPVLRDGLLFGLSNRGSLFCLDATTGATKWVESGTRQQSFGAVVDAGAALLALPSDSELVAFRPSGDRYEELARIKVSDTPVYAHPVVSGARIYVKDQETLTQFALQ